VVTDLPPTVDLVQRDAVRLSEIERQARELGPQTHRVEQDAF
jgi:hypothetical protein